MKFFSIKLGPQLRTPRPANGDDEVKRALALVTDAYGGKGGIAQAAQDVIAAFAACEDILMVEVLPRKAPDPVLQLPAKVRQANPCRGRLGYTARCLRTVLSAWPDIVFCNHLYMAPLAALVARLAGANLMVQLHGVEIWSEPKLWQRRAIEAADLLICVSRDTRSRALVYSDLPPERALVLNNTVDPRFSPGDRAVARAHFGLEKEFVLLIVGRLDAQERYKGHDRVIAALPQLVHPEGKPVLLLIAGEGDDRPRIEAEVAAAGVADKVRFLGQVAAEDLPELYRAADLFVLPSTGEGFGIVFIEAMACGTPALGIAAGGASDALGDGDLGVVVRSENELTGVLKEVIARQRRPDHQTAMFVQNRFGRKVFRPQIKKILKRLFS